MITVKGIPLINKEDAKRLSNLLLPDEDGDSHFDNIPCKFIWGFLPDQNHFENFGKQYKFKDIPEGMYLTGMEVMSREPLYPAFCHSVFENLGLFLKASDIYTSKGGRTRLSDALMLLRFEHVFNINLKQSVDHSLFYNNNHH